MSSDASLVSRDLRYSAKAVKGFMLTHCLLHNLVMMIRQILPLQELGKEGQCEEGEVEGEEEQRFLDR